MHDDSLSFLPYVGFIVFAVLYGLNEDNLRAFEHINEFAEFHEGNSFFFTLPVKEMLVHDFQTERPKLREK